MVMVGMVMIGMVGGRVVVMRRGDVACIEHCVVVLGVSGILVAMLVPVFAGSVGVVRSAA